MWGLRGIFIGRRGEHRSSEWLPTITAPSADGQHPRVASLAPMGAIHLLAAPTVLGGSYLVGVGDGFPVPWQFCFA